MQSHFSQATECAARRRKFCSELDRGKLDAALINSSENLRYLTGFTGSNGLAVLTPDRAILLTDPRYGLQASQETDIAIRVERGSLWAAAARLLSRWGCRLIGLEMERVSCAASDALRQRLAVRVRWGGIDSVLQQMRMVKSATEIEAIRRAARASSESYARALEKVKPEMSERDLAAELEYQMRRAGADGPAFDTIVACGKRSALPHASPSGALLGKGRQVLVDMGARLGGYASDMTRMFHFGSPGRRFRSLYAAVLEAQEACLEAARPGVTAARLDNLARRRLRAYGLEKAFVHSLGHGLGLEIHERPKLGKKDQTILEPGMVVTIEPGIYLQEFGGIRIEDTVVIREGSCEVLTQTTKQPAVL